MRKKANAGMIKTFLRASRSRKGLLAAMRFHSAGSTAFREELLVLAFIACCSMLRDCTQLRFRDGLRDCLSTILEHARLECQVGSLLRFIDAHTSRNCRSGSSRIVVIASPTPGGDRV